MPEAAVLSTLAIVLAPLLGAVLGALTHRADSRACWMNPAFLGCAISLMAATGLLLWMIQHAASEGSKVAGWAWIDFVSAGDFHVELGWQAAPLTCWLAALVALVATALCCVTRSMWPGLGPSGVSISLVATQLLLLSTNVLGIVAAWLILSTVSWWISERGSTDGETRTVASRCMARGGDALLGLAALMFWQLFGSLDVRNTLGDHDSLVAAGAAQPEVISILCLCLIGAVIARGAQFPALGALDETDERSPSSAIAWQSIVWLPTCAFLLVRFLPLLSLSQYACQFLMLVGALTSLLSAMTALTRPDALVSLRELSVGHVGVVLVGLAGGSPATIAAGVLLLSVTLLARPALLLAVAAHGGERSEDEAARRTTNGVLFLFATALLGSGLWGQAELLTALAEPVAEAESHAARSEAGGEVANSPPALFAKLERARGIAFWLVVAGLSLASCAVARVYLVAFRAQADAGDPSRRVPPLSDRDVSGGGRLLLGTLVLMLALAAIAPLALTQLPELSAKAWTGDPLTLGLTLICALFGVVLAWMWCARGGESALVPPAWFAPLSQISGDRFATTNLLVAAVIAPLQGVALILHWLLDAGPRAIVSVAGAMLDVFHLEANSRDDHAWQLSAVLVVLSTAVLLCLTLWLTM